VVSFLIVGLIIYACSRWPKSNLATIDWHGSCGFIWNWLLIGSFLFMSVTIVARAICAATHGSCWSRQLEDCHRSMGNPNESLVSITPMNVHRFDHPSVAIATLSIDRITRTLSYFFTERKQACLSKPYWLTFIMFHSIV